MRAFLTLMAGALCLAGSAGAAQRGYNPLSGGERSDSELLITPKQIDFGNQDMSVSASVLRTATVRNTSGSPLVDLVIHPPADPAVSVTHSCPDQLDSGQACVLSVIWAPRHAGKLDSAVMVQAGPAAVALSMIGMVTGSFSAQPKSAAGVGVVSLSQAEIDLVGVPAGSTDVELITNSGDRPLTLTQIKMATSDDPVFLSGSCVVLPKKLDPGDACALHVTSIGRNLHSAIVIEHDGLRGVSTVPVAIETGEEVPSKSPTTAGSPSAVSVPDGVLESRGAGLSSGRAPSPSSGRLRLVGRAGSSVLLSINGDVPQLFGSGARITHDGSVWVLELTAATVMLRHPVRGLLILSMEKEPQSQAPLPGGPIDLTPKGKGVSDRMRALDRLIEGEQGR